MKIKLFLKDYSAHIAVLLAGAAILFGGCFQNSLWFDEAYTVGLMQHSLLNVFKWATFDVHPHLYYVALKLFTMIFGDSLPAMRIFSALGAVMFASLGLTHLRKDFGRKVGFWFSFCAVFSASTLVYALQIRMYTWAAYFVALAAIYAFRKYSDPENRKNRILFLVCSVAAAYIHYFGLFAVAAVNLILLYRTNKDKRPVKLWLRDAAVQIGAYIPGLAVFLRQITLGGAGWIQIGWPDLVLDMVSYHLFGDVLSAFFEHKSIPYLVVGGVCLLLYVCGGVLLWRYAASDRIGENQKRALRGALCAYFGTLLFTVTVSLFRPIYYVRYTVVICGLLFFAVAVLLAGFRKKLFKIIAALVILAVFAVQTVYTYDLMYDPSANAVHDALDGNVREDDQFLFEGTHEYVVAMNYPDNESYFYNVWGWQVQKSYRAFGENSYVVDDLNSSEIASLGDRVWVIGNGSCYAHLLENGYSQTAQYDISMKYHQYSFTVYLMEK